jgi:hypothetical protein
MQHFRLNKRLGLSAAVTASLFLAGCVSIGPRGLELSRTEFNSAIQRTDGEQLLLNIVRQRYNDPVMFLEVASVSSSISRTASLNLSGFFPGGGSPESYNGGVGGSYSDSPLVFYSPNTGERFVRQILTPIDLRTISLLLQSGWSIERVLLVAGDSFAGLKNTTTGAGDYQALVDHLRTLQRADQLSFALETYNNVDILAMIPTPSALSTEAYKEACRLMNFPADGRPIRVQLGIGERPDPNSYVFLATRSLYSSFYFLSNGVEPPAGDLGDGVLQRRRLDGGVFDGDGDLFKVQTSPGRPVDAAVKVRYRDQWFFIPSNDPDSRTTFALLSMMLMLQSGDTARMAPLISLSPTR